MKVQFNHMTTNVAGLPAAPGDSPESVNTDQPSDIPSCTIVCSIQRVWAEKGSGRGFRDTFNVIHPSLKKGRVQKVSDKQDFYFESGRLQSALHDCASSQTEAADTFSLSSQTRVVSTDKVLIHAKNRTEEFSQ